MVRLYVKINEVARVKDILISYIIAIMMFNVEIRYSSHTWVNVYFEPRSSSSL